MNPHPSILLKVCGMRDPENIKALTRLSPDLIGFNFYPPSPRYVDIKKLHNVREFVPHHIALAGIFVNAPTYDIITLVNQVSLDYVQLHGNESPEQVNTIKSSGIQVIKAFHITPDFDFSEVGKFNEADYYLFDTPSAAYGGSGVPFRWEILRNYREDKPYFLSGGIGIEHVEAIKAIDLGHPPKGLDINSRFETAPGVKDLATIAQFFKQFRS